MEHAALTLSRLQEMLNYDPATGIFTWRIRPVRNSARKIGDIAGGLKQMKGKQYRYITLDGVSYVASQLAWLYVNGQWPTGSVTTKNGDPSDLREENLVLMRTGLGGEIRKAKDNMPGYRRALRTANLDYSRDLGLRRYYKIGIEDYNRMLAEQNGVCAICARPERAKSPWAQNGEIKQLSVDHSHDDDSVRGLLCGACNHMLGHAGDDPSVLRHAADYLELHLKKKESS